MATPAHDMKETLEECAVAMIAGMPTHLQGVCSRSLGGLFVLGYDNKIKVTDEEFCTHIIPFLNIIHSKLKMIDLSNNQIGNRGAKELSEILKVNNTVDKLFISNSPIGAEGIKHLAEALKQNTTLKSMDLSGISIGEGGATHLIDALRKNKILTLLRLENSPIGAEALKNIEEAINQNRIAEKFCLSYKSIAEVIYKMHPRLHKACFDALTGREFNLYKMDITDEEFSAYIIPFLKIISTHSYNGFSLNFSCNKIANKGIKEFAEILKTNMTFMKVNLCSNQIGEAGAEHLADALKLNENLTELDLNSNAIGNMGAKHLAEALKQNEILTHLNIDVCGIGDEGIQHLSEALKQNKNLKYLDLQWNVIGDVGMRYLANAIKVNKVLSILALGHSDKVSNEGAELMLNALAERSLNTTFPEISGMCPFMVFKDKDRRHYEFENNTFALHNRAMRLVAEAQARRLAFCLGVFNSIGQTPLISDPDQFMNLSQEIFEMADCNVRAVPLSSVPTRKPASTVLAPPVILSSTSTAPKHSVIGQSVLTEISNMVTGVLSRNKEMAEEATTRIVTAIGNHLQELNAQDIQDIHQELDTLQKNPAELDETLQSDIFQRVERCKVAFSSRPHTGVNGLK